MRSGILALIFVVPRRDVGANEFFRAGSSRTCCFHVPMARPVTDSQPISSGDAHVSEIAELFEPLLAFGRIATYFGQEARHVAERRRVPKISRKQKNASDPFTREVHRRRQAGSWNDPMWNKGVLLSTDALASLLCK